MSRFWSYLVHGSFADWSVNRGDMRIQLALVMFRTARRFRTSSVLPARVFGKMLCLIYVVVVEWTWGIEIPWRTEIGPALRIFHGTGIVINADSRLGRDVVLRQGVCIGSRLDLGPAPAIGNGVNFGAGSMVLGGCEIGDSARIGAGALVLNDVPPGRSAVGNPARLV
jgi:putative colanic acid biosynthesis acetyltransferase WcaB